MEVPLAVIAYLQHGFFLEEDFESLAEKFPLRDFFADWIDLVLKNYSKIAKDEHELKNESIYGKTVVGQRFAFVLSKVGIFQVYGFPIT
jgi:hypothetical protein